MTTAIAEKAYLYEHLRQWEGKGYAVFNPHEKPIHELPVIYGFNNGGGSYFLSAVLIAEDGTALGSHTCSNEGYMPHDLGILEGSRPDRHETFRAHYPDGYRMDFVGYNDAAAHEGLQRAFKLNEEKQKVAQSSGQ